MIVTHGSVGAESSAGKRADAKSTAHDAEARGGRRRNKPLPDNPDQQHFSRGAQLQMLRDCQLPTLKKIRGNILKSVLRVIDDHAGRNVEAWPSQETIATEAVISYRQAQRAIAVLVELSLICVRRVPLSGGGRTGCRNHYRIVWNELALRCPPIPSEHDQTDGSVALVATDLRAPGGALVERDLHAPQRRPTRPGEPTYAPPGAQEAPTKRTRTDHHPQSPPSDETELPADWAAVVKAFEGKQAIVRDLAAEYLAKGSTAIEFREVLTRAWAIAETPANAGRFTNPAGAVASFIRRGSWPVAGVVTPEAAADRLAASNNEARENWLQGELRKLLPTARKINPDPQAVRAYVRDHLPIDFCERVGY